MRPLFNSEVFSILCPLFRVSFIRDSTVVSNFGKARKNKILASIPDQDTNHKYCASRYIFSGCLLMPKLSMVTHDIIETFNNRKSIQLEPFYQRRAKETALYKEAINFFHRVHLISSQFWLFANSFLIFSASNQFNACCYSFEDT